MKPELNFNQKRKMHVAFIKPLKSSHQNQRQIMNFNN